MNAMHTLVFSLFLASKPGILQPLPLKLNFVPKFERSHVSECGTDLNRLRSLSSSMVISLDIIGYIPCPDPSGSLLMSGTDTFFSSMFSSNILSLSSCYPRILELGHLMVLMDFTNSCDNGFLSGYPKLGCTSYDVIWHCGVPAAVPKP